jgi:hypothetical protein
MASSFDALLGKLSSLLGDDQPEAAPQARNALASKVGFRASMLPIGNYDDGSIAFPVWPQSAVDAGNALMRFHRGEAPRPEDAVLAGLAVAGGGLGHLGLRGSARAVSGKALEGVEASRPLTSSPVEAGSVFSNPKEAAPTGLLATSAIDRMAADDAIKPRPFPDAPLTYPELEEFVRTNRGGYSQSRADQAWREDPARYDAYGRGLHDVLSPESQWFNDGPTLQSGGSVAPAAATSSGEHHSRSQPRGEGGRFVARESFDGKMAALDKMLVDLDGDGTPDVAVDVPRPGNALLRTAARMPDQDVLRPPPPLQADVYEALRRERLNDPPMYRVQTPAGGRIAPPFISDRTILDQSDADRGLNLNVPAYFPKLLP